MYKIKFLDELLWNKEQTETKPVFKTQFFSDADIHEVARLWQILPGLKRVDEIELKGECKLTIVEVIELFYPENAKQQNGEIKVLSEHDKKQKALLLEKYGKKKPELSDKDTEKTYRAEMRTKLKKVGKNPPNNATTADLEKAVSELTPEELKAAEAPE